MFDEMDKNSTRKNKVSPQKFLNDDNKIDTITPIENDHFNMKIEEKCP